MSINTVLQSILLIVFGYLIGSVPAGYLAGKWIKGIDLRNYGSGTVSGSMVWEHVSHWATVPVVIFDIFKGALAAWLGLQYGGGVEVAALASIAAVIGHNWPLYLKFTGGRGLSPFAGMLLVIFPWGFAWLVVPIVIGYFLGDSAPWALASLVSMPILANWLGAPPAVSWSIIAMVMVTLLKRLQANGRPLPKDGKERRKMILRRLVFDRDIASHKDWIDRQRDES